MTIWFAIVLNTVSVGGVSRTTVESRTPFTTQAQCDAAVATARTLSAAHDVLVLSGRVYTTDTAMVCVSARMK